MNERIAGILLHGTDAQPRNAQAEDKYRLLAGKMAERSLSVGTLTYHDSRRQELHHEARKCAAVLVWINPLEPGLDRPALDSFLREMAADGILVSAHPDAILRLGTKDVLVTTQLMDWSVDTVVHRSLAEFRARFPDTVRTRTRAGAEAVPRARSVEGVRAGRSVRGAAGGAGRAAA